jgi:hypothetical protein
MPIASGSRFSDQASLIRALARGITDHRLLHHRGTTKNVGRSQSGSAPRLGLPLRKHAVTREGPSKHAGNNLPKVRDFARSVDKGKGHLARGKRGALGKSRAPQGGRGRARPARITARYDRRFFDLAQKSPAPAGSFRHQRIPRRSELRRLALSTHVDCVAAH